MKKTIALFFALILTCAALGGCGEKDTPASQIPSQTSSEDTSSKDSPAGDTSSEESSPESAPSEAAATDPSAPVDTSGWTERDYHGLRFLLPEEWVGSANNVAFFGTLPCGETANLAVTLHSLEGDFSWDVPEDWEAVKVRLNEEAAGEEGYQEIDCQEGELCGQPGLIRHYKALLGSSEFELASYSTVASNRIITFRTNVLPEQSDQAKAELERIITAAMNTADFSGLED